MSRADVINRCAAAIGAIRYLEIGVEDGTTFRAVGISEKHSVDPALKADPQSLGGQHYAMTSDEFFYRHGSAQFDIVFIDGMHTFDQSLADLLNAIPRLTPSGVIVLDDVYPTDYLASLRDHERCRRRKEMAGLADRNWMGDVYKTVAFVHDMLPDLSYGTCDDGSGHKVTVLWQDAPRSDTKMFETLGAISGLHYVDFLDTQGFLKQVAFSEIIDRLSLRTSEARRC